MVGLYFKNDQTVVKITNMIRMRNYVWVRIRPLCFLSKQKLRRGVLSTICMPGPSASLKFILHYFSKMYFLFSMKKKSNPKRIWSSVFFFGQAEGLGKSLIMRFNVGQRGQGRPICIGPLFSRIYKVDI